MWRVGAHRGFLLDPILWDWASFALRWLHVVTAIAWIGSSFYFIALDLGLRKHAGLPAGVGGEAWQVHGGGFYHVQKYMVAPAALPQDLTWFKWEAYSTWLSGFFLLCVVYYAGAELFLIDREIADLPVWGAIFIGLATLALGWIVYDLLCRSPLGRNDWRLIGVLFVVFVAIAFVLTRLLSGRGAYIHVGALIATIMTANVFFVIIPNQTKVVAALRRQETPDPELGRQAKQRSLHNNYLTLPVVFLMLSSHLPLAFATRFNWLIVALVLAMGALIRHFFNTMHASHRRPWWTWALTTLLFLVATWLSTFGPRAAGGADAAEAQPVVQAGFEEARDIVFSYCSMCHAAEPLWPGLAGPPQGVVLDTDAGVERYARDIYLQAARSRAMPPGNVTGMTDEDRAILAAWYENRGAH